MSENKKFNFGIDTMTWKQEILDPERRFTDLEGFLDEEYEGEHHMVWDNQEEQWCHLDDALCLMEKEYYDIKNENEQLISEMGELGTAHAEEINSIEDKFDEEILKLEKENEQLKQDKKRLIGYLHRYSAVDIEDVDEVVLSKEYLDEWGELYDER